MGPPIWYLVLTEIWEKIKGTTQFGTRVLTDFEIFYGPTHRLWVGTQHVGRCINGFDYFDKEDDNIDIHLRRSRDKGTNNYGMHLVQSCKIYNFVIINGRTQSDSVGNFTCIANKVRSVEDYCIINKKKLYDHVIDIIILSRTDSDHFPLLLNLKSNVCCE